MASGDRRDDPAPSRESPGSRPRGRDLGRRAASRVQRLSSGSGRRERAARPSDRGGPHMTRAGLALALALVSPVAAAAADVPFLTGRVVDNAQILSSEARTRLTAMLKAHEDATGNQIAVLTVPTIRPQSIEEFAVAVFNSWKLGQKARNNGVLVVVVPEDRRMRIEVGYGLEPVLTDSTAGAII